MDSAAKHFAINTYSYTMRCSATEALRSLADKGYTTFELMMYPGHLWPAEANSAARRELRQLIDRLAVRVITLNMPNVDLNIAGATQEMRNYSLGVLGGIIELAGEIGVPGVVLGPGKPNPLYPAPEEQLLSYFYAALEHLLPIAKSSGTSILIENMPFAFLPGIRPLMMAIEKFGEGSVGVVYDLANGYFLGEEICASLHVAAKRLRLVHVSDTRKDHYRHDPVGMGTVPFEQVPPVLKDIGYKELPVLELLSSKPESAIELSARRLVQLGWSDASTAS